MYLFILFPLNGKLVIFVRYLFLMSRGWVRSQCSESWQSDLGTAGVWSGVELSYLTLPTLYMFPAGTKYYFDKKKSKQTWGCPSTASTLLSDNRPPSPAACSAPSAAPPRSPAERSSRASASWNKLFGLWTHQPYNFWTLSILSKRSLNFFGCVSNDILLR